MKRGSIVLIVVLAVIVLLVALFVGTYNSLVSLEENVNQSWAQVSNQYQRRADLIPNLVETVKGYASHERETFEAVTDARARVGQLNISPEVLTDPEAFARFQEAQGLLSNALSRLMAVAENYPALRANENFLALQSQLEGTENRISVERRRFNESVQRFNTTIRRYPAVLIARMLGFAPKLYFEAEPGAEEVPEVRFD